MHDQEYILRSPAQAARDPQAAEPLAVVLGGENGKRKSRLLPIGIVVLIIGAILLGLWLAGMATMEHQPGFWGISIASVLFWLSVTQGMLAVGALIRLAHASWRYPLTRMLDMVSLFGIWLVLLLPLLWKMRDMVYSPMGSGNSGHVVGATMTGQDLYATNKLWRMTPSGSFGIDCGFIITSYLAGVFLLFLTSRPDFAGLRDRAAAGKKRGYARLAAGWRGTQSQWRALRWAEGFLVVAVVMLFFASQTVIGWDFQLAAGADWDSSIFPFQVNLAGLMSGCAMLVLVMTAVRYSMRSNAIGDKQYDAIGKLMIALGLLFFYFRWCDYITAWYGHTPEEWQTQLGRIIRYPIAFTLTVVGCMAVPIFANIFKGVRTSPFWLSCISVLMLVGIWCQKFLDTVPTFGYGAAGAMDPAAAWAGALTLVGFGALFLLTYFFGMPLFSAMSWWSLSKWRTRSAVRPMGNATVTVMVEDPPVWEN
jgi:hypothetical protein